MSAGAPILPITSKIYPYETLLSDDVKLRTELIEKVSHKTGCVTEFEWKNVFLRRIAQRLPADKQPFFYPKRRCAFILADMLNFAHSVGLVHGSLCLETVWIVGKDPVITDWEPDLLQMVKHRPTLMCRPPAIHPKDFLEKRLTKRTDWLCFTTLLTGLNRSVALAMVDEEINRTRMTEGLMYRIVEKLIPSNR